MEARILSLAICLPQERNDISATILDFHAAALRGPQPSRGIIAAGPERRPMWGAAPSALSKTGRK
jgi:hypothetical protein